MTRNGKEFRIWAKTQLMELGLRVEDLAAKIGYPRRTVSAAINGSPYPHVVQAIATELKHDSKANGPLPVSPARPERRVRAAAGRAR